VCKILNLRAGCGRGRQRVCAAAGSSPMLFGICYPLALAACRARSSDDLKFASCEQGCSSAHPMVHCAFCSCQACSFCTLPKLSSELPANKPALPKSVSERPANNPAPLGAYEPGPACSTRLANDVTTEQCHSWCLKVAKLPFQPYPKCVLMCCV
jgi:hypothetical protein